MIEDIPTSTAPDPIVNDTPPAVAPAPEIVDEVVDEVPVHCVSCGSPEHLKVVEDGGKVPVDLDVNPNQSTWRRFWVKCFKCGGKQPYDSPDPQAIEPPAQEFVPAGGLSAPTGDLTALANSGKSLESVA